jgi:hypothetical protein
VREFLIDVGGSPETLVDFGECGQHIGESGGDQDEEGEDGSAVEKQAAERRGSVRDVEDPSLDIKASVPV